jgi:CRP/FNR family cyclic AMP-dependent transcriptional regulator
MLATFKQTAELVDLFQREGRRLEFHKGDFIIHPGELPPGVFYIQKGIVKAYDITRYGDENLLSIRKEHELFPLIWAITGQERQVIFQALAPTIVWRLSRTHFTQFTQHHPDALAPLLDMTIEMYRLHSERIINLEYRTVRERIISFLITMASRFGVDKPEGTLIELPLKHQDIASSVNATRETTSRELSALEKKGLLSTKQSMILLRDVKALEAHLSR